jgi:hypothetical protein
MMDSEHDYTSDSDFGRPLLELALALGLVRVMTLLPLYDPALDVVEKQIALAYEQLAQMQSRRDRDLQ